MSLSVQWKRGRDGAGSETWARSQGGVDWLITDHRATGIDLWRLSEGIGGRVHVSTGFRSVAAAADYVCRRIGA